MNQSLNLLPIAMAILCYSLAALLQSDNNAHDGLILLAGLLSGWAFKRPSDLASGKKKSPSTGQNSP